MSDPVDQRGSAFDWRASLTPAGHPSIKWLTFGRRPRGLTEASAAAEIA
jgi:hypothetical protein